MPLGHISFMLLVSISPFVLRVSRFLIPLPPTYNPPCRHTPGKKPATVEASSSKGAPAAEPGLALLPSTITNKNRLARVGPLLASVHHEGGATKI